MRLIGCSEIRDKTLRRHHVVVWLEKRLIKRCIHLSLNGIFDRFAAGKMLPDYVVLLELQVERPIEL